MTIAEPPNASKLSNLLSFTFTTELTINKEAPLLEESLSIKSVLLIVRVL